MSGKGRGEGEGSGKREGKGRGRRVSPQTQSPNSAYVVDHLYGCTCLTAILWYPMARNLGRFLMGGMGKRIFTPTPPKMHQNASFSYLKYKNSVLDGTPEKILGTGLTRPLKARFIKL
jgi:hypothetical protein